LPKVKLLVRQQAQRKAWDSFHLDFGGLLLPFIRFFLQLINAIVIPVAVATLVLPTPPWPAKKMMRNFLLLF
jgi:hypothetical protein